MRRTALWLFAVSACSAGQSDLELFPNTFLVSGAEMGAGATTYRVTIAASGASGVTWESADPSIATVAGSDSLGTVTALKVGTTTIRARAGDTTVELPLTVNAYQPSDRQAGASMWAATCATANCHDANGPDVTPSGIGKHTDDEVTAVITLGKNPEGGDVSIGAAAHSFPLAQGSPAYSGIVAYMRAMDPGVPVEDE